MAQVLLYRMPSGIPGDISRRQSATVEPVVMDAAFPFASYGIPYKRVSGKARPLASGDVATVIVGFLVRPYPTQTSNADGSGVHSGPIGDGLRRGYITVKNNAGVPAVDGVVYARVANPVGGKPIGGIEAVADSTNTVIVAGARFTGPADAAGNVEIEFNL